MKKLVKILALSLVFVFCFAFVACGGSSYSKIETALGKADFKVNQNAENVLSSIKTELNKSDLAVEFHVLTREEDSSGTTDFSHVIVLEFNATDDLVEACKESSVLKAIVKDAVASEDLKEAYDKLVQEGWANGNCLVYGYTSSVRSEVKKIVKNA